MFKFLFRNGLPFFISLLLIGYTADAQNLQSMDIGDAADTPGSTQIEGSTITIEAGGHDIWDDADGFRFVYASHSGDFDAQVHLISFEPIGDWSKAAIMGRQSLAPESEHVISTVTGGGAGGSQLTWRKDGQNDETDDQAPGDWTHDSWLRLTRTGDEFEGQISDNGVDWLPLGTLTLVMTDPIFVGLAVTPAEAGSQVMAVFDQFTINGSPTAVAPNGKLAVTWGKLKQR